MTSRDPPSPSPRRRRRRAKPPSVKPRLEGSEKGGMSILHNGHLRVSYQATQLLKVLDRGLAAARGVGVGES